MSLGTLQRNKGRAKVRGVGIFRSVVTDINPVEGETIYFEHDFEDGTLGPFGASGQSITVSTDHAQTGTQSAKCVAGSSANNARVTCQIRAEDNPMYETSGLYIRWSFLITAATVQTAIDSTNFKYHLARIPIAEGQGSWLMGSLASSPANKFRYVVDAGIVTLPDDACPGPGGLTTITIVGDTWYTMQVWYKYDSVASEGRAKAWMRIADTDQWSGGCQFDVTHANLGPISSPPRDNNFWFGIPHIGGGVDIVVHTDNIVLANFFQPMAV